MIPTADPAAVQLVAASLSTYALPGTPQLVANHVARCFAAAAVSPMEALRCGDYSKTRAANRDPRNVADRRLVWWLARHTRISGVGVPSYPDITAACGFDRRSHSIVFDGVFWVQCLLDEGLIDHPVVMRLRLAKVLLSPTFTTTVPAAPVAPTPFELPPPVFAGRSDEPTP